MFAGPVHAHHDDADADADPADDVQLAVEHLINSRRTALMIQGRGRERKNILETEDRPGGGRQQQHNSREVWLCASGPLPW